MKNKKQETTEKNKVIKFPSLKNPYCLNRDKAREKIKTAVMLTGGSYYAELELPYLKNDLAQALKEMDAKKGCDIYATLQFPSELPRFLVDASLKETFTLENLQKLNELIFEFWERPEFDLYRWERSQKFIGGTSLDELILLFENIAFTHCLEGVFTLEDAAKVYRSMMVKGGHVEKTEEETLAQMEDFTIGISQYGLVIYMAHNEDMKDLVQRMSKMA